MEISYAYPHASFIVAFENTNSQFSKSALPKSDFKNAIVKAQRGISGNTRIVCVCVYTLAARKLCYSPM